MKERKLFVGGLNKDDTDEGKIKGYFSQYGDIVDVTIMRDQNKVSRGFGFVLFESNTSVDNIMRAKKEGSSFTLDNHNVEVKRALPKISGAGESGSRNNNSGGGGMHRKIFVGGLASTADETSVSEYFEKFGEVTEVELLRCRETNRLRGFAFVTFQDEDSADKCIQKRNHIINKKSCEVKRAQTRSNLNRDEDHHHTPRARESRDAGPPVAPQIVQPGMFDINMVNQLITEAYNQGYKQGLSQANPASALLGGNIGGLQTPSAASLLQALQSPPVSVPTAPPQQPTQTQNGDIATQLVGLLRQAQSNPDIMALIGSAGKESGRPTEQRPPTSSSTSYSTSYPAPSTYDYYTQQSNASNYGPVKEDDHKQRAYRPY